MITATVNGWQMPPIELDFIDTPIENATDVITIDGSIYTDFVNQLKEWTFNYSSMTKAQYDRLRAEYDKQFTLYEYPTLEIPFFSFSGKTRMYISNAKIWNNCGDVEGIEVKFREAIAPEFTS